MVLWHCDAACISAMRSACCASSLSISFALINAVSKVNSCEMILRYSVDDSPESRRASTMVLTRLRAAMKSPAEKPNQTDITISSPQNELLGLAIMCLEMIHGCGLPS